jgi:hypothetical protein
MKINRFWEEWENKTKLEKKYIISLEKAVIWISQQSFFKDIQAVYVKGSFVFRELNEKSDIDLVPIVKTNDVLDKVRALRDAHKEELNPASILPMSIQELKENELYAKSELKGQPDNFVLLLPYHKLVYGKPINPEGCKVRPLEKIKDDLRSGFVKKLIPMYKKREFGFTQLMKKYPHLAYWEERINGKVFAPSWKAILKARPGDDLLQQAAEFRFHPTKNKRKREKFIKDLEEYLSRKEIIR